MKWNARGSWLMLTCRSMKMGREWATTAAWCIRGKTIVGFSVIVHGLTEEGSVKLQEEGIGGRGKMGCGFFVPLGRRKWKLIQVASGPKARETTKLKFRRCLAGTFGRRLPRRRKGAGGDGGRSTRRPWIEGACDYLDRLRRCVLLAAAVHDLGKANDHFQGMILRTKDRKECNRAFATSGSRC